MFELDDESKIRRLAFFVSLLTHVVFFILCYLFISPVKVYIMDNVREVVIVPDHDLIIPPFGEIISRMQPPQDDLLEGIARVALDPDHGSPDQELVKKAPIRNHQGHAIDSRLVEFYLGSPGSKPSASLQDFSLSLSKSSDKGMIFSREQEKYSRRNNVDFSKYSNIARNYSVRRRGAFIEKVDYDFGQWAEKVLTAVQQNWFLKPTQLESADGEIKISVVIGQEGQLLSTEILDSSSFPLLENSALSALEMSAPFPLLPEEYPGESLEILLVFSCQ